MIEVAKLSRKFDDTYVLKEVSTYFEKGKTNLIIGQSGSGKTVFLNFFPAENTHSLKVNSRVYSPSPLQG